MAEETGELCVEGAWLMPTRQYAADVSGAALVPAWERSRRLLGKVSAIQENTSCG